MLFCLGQHFENVKPKVESVSPLGSHHYTQKQFNGYAFKFGKCQKIQRFSDKAVRQGLYSAVVTDDIVVFGDVVLIQNMVALQDMVNMP